MAGEKACEHHTVARELVTVQARRQNDIDLMYIVYVGALYVTEGPRDWCEAFAEKLRAEFAAAVRARVGALEEALRECDTLLTNYGEYHPELADAAEVKQIVRAGLAASPPPPPDVQ